MSKLAVVFLAFVLAAGLTAEAGTRGSGKSKSTITFGKSEKLSSQAARKRNFRQDIEAVNTSHDAWKKAHLNQALYLCQRNGERIAGLAKKVYEKIDTARKSAIGHAKKIEGTITFAIGDEATEVPEKLSEEKLAELRGKIQALKNASAQAMQLEKLAGQVMMFYQNDAPKMPYAAGDCTRAYPVALRKGILSSEQYHADAEALSKKLEKLLNISVAALHAQTQFERIAQGR